MKLWWLWQILMEGLINHRDTEAQRGLVKKIDHDNFELSLFQNSDFLKISVSLRLCGEKNND